MFFADFVTFDGDRYFVSTDTKAGKTRIERISNAALERFIINILTMPDPLEVTSNKEVSA